jgi:hypothetical protein
MPALCRASTSSLGAAAKSWMAGTSPAMTESEGGHLTMRAPRSADKMARVAWTYVLCAAPQHEGRSGRCGPGSPLADARVGRDDDL